MANEVLQKYGSTVTWRDGGGTYAMDLTGLANNAGRVGPVHDRGVARSRKLAVTMLVQYGTSPTDGTTFDVYLATSSDNSAFDGGLSAGDAALGSADTLRQLVFVGGVLLDNVTSAQQATWEIELGARYIVPVVYNNGTGQSTSTTAAQVILSVTPIVDEIQ